MLKKSHKEGVIGNNAKAADWLKESVAIEKEAEKSATDKIVDTLMYFVKENEKASKEDKDYKLEIDEEWVMDAIAEHDECIYKEVVKKVKERVKGKGIKVTAELISKKEVKEKKEKV